MRAERRDVLDAAGDKRDARGVARGVRSARGLRLVLCNVARSLLIQPTIPLELVPRVEQLREVGRRELGEELVRLGRLRDRRNEVTLLGASTRTLGDLALRLAVRLGLGRRLRVEIGPTRLVRRRANVPVALVLLVIRYRLRVLCEVGRAGLGGRARVGVRVRGRRTLDLRFLRRRLADVGSVERAT